MQRHEGPQEHMFERPKRNSVRLEARGRARRENNLKTHRREARILVNNVILLVCIPVLICEEYLRVADELMLQCPSSRLYPYCFFLSRIYNNTWHTVSTQLTQATIMDVVYDL